MSNKPMGKPFEETPDGKAAKKKYTTETLKKPENRVRLASARAAQKENGAISTVSGPVEGKNWWKKKGALLFWDTGNVGEAPSLSLFFQRFPTEYGMEIKPVLATQQLPGQTGTSAQLLGSASPVYRVQLLFHDAFLAKEQVTTARGISQLATILKTGWTGRVLWTMGASPPAPIIIRSFSVTMSHFVPAGHGRKIYDFEDKLLSSGGYGDRQADEPQRALVNLEFMADDSREIIIPFVNRKPKPRKPTPAKECETSNANSREGFPAPAPQVTKADKKRPTRFDYHEPLVRSRSEFAGEPDLKPWQQDDAGSEYMFYNAPPSGK